MNCKKGSNAKTINTEVRKRALTFRVLLKKSSKVL